ncbi:MAG: Na+/H+ antiporter NhaA [Acidimicrobiales bacterium]|nr:Na+/H+ antiporter NhaA [Acidimicrobiales bacterium]
MYDSSPPSGDIPHTWAESDRFVPRSFVRPLQRFMDAEASSAIFMLIAAVAALVWANSPWHHAQQTLWETPLTFHLGELAHLELTLVEWVNDALMAVFFFVVGLEIKRELVHGELRDPRKAALPAIGAVGGMILPAAVYLLFNTGGDGSQGWGIPMATDIAFAVAVVALVGPRIPNAAKVFLLTLAIADDIGAITVIAIFYTDDLSFGWLAIAFATVIGLVIAKRLEVRSMPLYVAGALFLWFAVHESGVHATLAGVTLGLLTPAWSFFDPRRFSTDAQRLVDAAAHTVDDGRMTSAEYELNQARLEELHRLVVETQSPLERLDHVLERWVLFVIVPLFAFSNAGVRLTGDAVDGLLTDRVVLGVALGLIVGKTLGVFSATVIADRLGIGSLPAGVTYRHVLGLAVTAGIGFTVALFVAGLAFETAALADSAKIGILGGSIIAGIAGYLILRTSPPQPSRDPAAPVAEPALTD